MPSFSGPLEYQYYHQKHTYFAEAHITLLLYALFRGVKGLLFA